MDSLGEDTAGGSLVRFRVDDELAELRVFADFCFDRF